MGRNHKSEQCEFCIVSEWSDFKNLDDSFFSEPDSLILTSYYDFPIAVESCVYSILRDLSIYWSHCVHMKNEIDTSTSIEVIWRLWWLSTYVFKKKSLEALRQRWSVNESVTLLALRKLYDNLRIAQRSFAERSLYYWAEIVSEVGEMCIGRSVIQPRPTG